MFEFHPTYVPKEVLPGTKRYGEGVTRIINPSLNNIMSVVQEPHEVFPEEILKGYKVFGPHFETQNDVSSCGEKRYYHLDGRYYFEKEKLNEQFGFRFYKSLSDCYKEYNEMPIARICRVWILGEIVVSGQQAITNDILIEKEIKNPFRSRYKKIKLN